MAEPILQMRGIKKSFHGVKALSDVSLTVLPGQIHAVVGENGAGKSTLMKVLSGVYPFGEYEGQIQFMGEDCRFKGIADSEAKGIIIIHQELALVPLLSIAENIFLGNEQAKRGVIDWSISFQKTQALLKKVGLKESPSALITNLGVGKQQLVEIAKALSKEVKLLILDEPTASLNETDSDALLQLLLELKRQGIACILISHKLNEIAKVADSTTVLRDGATVATLNSSAKAVNEDQIIQHMVGREMADRYPKRVSNIGDTVFEIKNWKVHHELHVERQIIKGIDLQIKRGEILGIAGLMGAGRTELAMSIFGRSYGQRISGQVFLNGKEIDTSTVQKAIDHGIAYVTEDRKGYGLVLNETIAWNTTLANLKAVSQRHVIDEGREYKVAQQFRNQLNIRSPNVFASTVNLSGGNQQKVVLSKWLFTDPQVLILDEPTRGIDVGAKYEIYSIIAQLAAEGKSVLLISSEMPELLGMCDRICVLNEGRIVAQFTAAQASQEKIMRSIVLSGVKEHVAS
jgi:putative multiple sugar transport system ATP-binding protein